MAHVRQSRPDYGLDFLRANVAHARQSWPVFDLDFQIKGPEAFEVVLLSLGSGQ